MEGWPAGQYLRDLGLGLDARLRLFAEVCAAVVALHEQGLAHGRLNSENVRVTIDGRVKLTDLGLAERLTADEWNSPRETEDVSALGRILVEFTVEEAASNEVAELRAKAAMQPPQGYASAAELGEDVARLLVRRSTVAQPGSLLERLRRRLAPGRE